MKAGFTFLILIFILLLVSCSARSSKTYSEGLDDKGATTQTTETEIEFYPDNPRKQLALAKRLASEGDYKTATRLFQKLYDSTENAAWVREDALFQLGKTRSNILNPRKDLKAAQKTFEKLLAEYPQSKFASDAEASLQELKTLLKK